ncbi:26S proteasome non-ATPase regulatory subunit 13 [Chionoecetes opilio]|uniref:26S proteasome non-ATPase regulatory subunit 13 n=1 Tax=Chionoecetes opilio TaxID=41210 RepID=A0A8J8WAI2_CHIOP|nr:26S proteasome non-ATPase regulatory subunit 13 [Chionoecetes opilio]
MVHGGIVLVRKLEFNGGLPFCERLTFPCSWTSVTVPPPPLCPRLFLHPGPIHTTHLPPPARLPLSFKEMTFKRKAWDRQLTFDEIARETGLPKGQVEVMVMRALSLGLVKGTIDQVECKVNITWVQPRVLDKKQLASMMDRLTDWCKDVNGMQNLLQEQASTILTL